MATTEKDLELTNAVYRERCNWSDLTAYLRRVLSLVGDLECFIRQLSWMPENYPIFVDQYGIIPASFFCIETTEDAQVLRGLWSSFSTILSIPVEVDFSGVHIDFFDKASYTYLGYMSLYEGVLCLNRVRPPIKDNEFRAFLLPDLSENSSESEALDSGSFTDNPTGGLIRLSESGLMRVSPCSFTSSGRILQAANFDLKAWRKPGSFILDPREVSPSAVFGISDRFGQLQRKPRTGLSKLPLSYFEKSEPPAFGTSFYFDLNWNLVLACDAMPGRLGFQVYAQGGERADAKDSL